MELGMIGLGRMGTSVVRHLLRAGHQCVVYDIHPEPVQALVKG
jgi:6-phosphogluconate dehydrogenase